MSEIKATENFYDYGRTFVSVLQYIPPPQKCCQPSPILTPTLTSIILFTCSPSLCFCLFSNSTMASLCRSSSILRCLSSSANFLCLSASSSSFLCLSAANLSLASCSSLCFLASCSLRLASSAAAAAAWRCCSASANNLHTNMHTHVKTFTSPNSAFDDPLPNTKPLSSSLRSL